MAANIKPSPPAKSPLINDAPASVPINVMPMIAMMNSSGDPKRRTSGRMIGIDRARERAPMIAPTTEARDRRAQGAARFAVFSSWDSRPG